MSPEIRPVTALRGVGDALAAKLAKLGITTIQDLLFLLPLRYEDRTQVVPIGSLSHGDRAVVEGEVKLAEIAFRGRRQLLCRIGDGSGWLTLRGNVDPGEVMEIRLAVWDTGGHIYDSLVLLDAWEWALDPAEPGVTPG